jgi:hypothetical protein
LLKYHLLSGGEKVPRFIPYDYDQTSMVVINYKDQLQPGTFEHAVHFLIDTKLDLSIFYPKFKNNNNGRPAYDPAILLKKYYFHIRKALHPAVKFNGAVKQILSSKLYPAIPFLISLRLLLP